MFCLVFCSQTESVSTIVASHRHKRHKLVVWNLTAAAHGKCSHVRPLLGSKLEYMADSGHVWECFPCAATVRLKSEHMADSGCAWETFPCAATVRLKSEHMADSGRTWEMFPCAATVRLKSEHMADSGRAWETFPCAVAEHPGLYFNNLEGVSIIQLVST